MSAGVCLRKSDSQPVASQVEEVLQSHVECSICFGTLYNAASCTPCLHTFCMGCISRWADTNNGNCPMCRVSVKEITPNRAFRDLVNSYLLVRPDQKRLQKDMERLDKAELEHILKWLGATDENLLHIESLASLQGAPERCDQKYNNMMTRAVDLFKVMLERNNSEKSVPIPNEAVKLALEELLKDMRKEVMPSTIFTKYHRIERAYRKLVKISMPMIGPTEHTWLGNYCFDKDFADPDSTGSEDEYSPDEEDGWSLNLSVRISDVANTLRNPTLPSRRQARPRIEGFDPTDLEALARVQRMRAPGFRREPQENVEPTLVLPPRARNRASDITGARPQVTSTMQTRRQLRELTFSALTPETVPVDAMGQSSRRRSARLAARTQEV